MYFYGFSLADDQKQIPVVRPVVDHDYVFKNPIFGGELSFRNNLTSLSRDTANFDPITQAAINGSLCWLDQRRSHRQDHGQLPAARRTRQLHPLLHRMDVETHRHRSARADVHAVRHHARAMSPT